MVSGNAVSLESHLIPSGFGASAQKLKAAQALVVVYKIPTRRASAWPSARMSKGIFYKTQQNMFPLKLCQILRRELRVPVNDGCLPDLFASNFIRRNVEISIDC